MSYVANQDNTRSFTAYSLVELLPEIIQASKEGFELNFEQNSGVPVQFGVVTCLTMFPAKKETLTEPSVKEVKEVIESVKLEGSVSDYFKEEVKPIPLGEAAPPVKVDKRRKQV